MDTPAPELVSKLQCPMNCTWLIYDRKDNPICRRFNRVYLKWVLSWDDKAENGIYRCDVCLKGGYNKGGE